MKTGKEKKRIHFTPEVPKDDDFDYKESTTFSCILSSAKGQFMAACISGVAKIDGTYQNCQWLACFDIYTHEMLVYSTAFYYTKMQVSQVRLSFSIKRFLPSVADLHEKYISYFDYYWEHLSILFFFCSIFPIFW